MTFDLLCANWLTYYRECVEIRLNDSLRWTTCMHDMTPWITLKLAKAKKITNVPIIMTN